MKNIKKAIASVVVAGSIMAGIAPNAGAIVNPTYVDSNDIVADAVALIVIPSEYLNSGGSCTGALIDPEWVITATHCFGEDEKYIPGGEYEPPVVVDYVPDSYEHVDDYQEEGDNDNSFLDSLFSNVMSSSSSFVGGNLKDVNQPSKNNSNSFKESRMPIITFGSVKGSGPKYRATHVYSHPKGIHGMDMSLIKLDRPVTDFSPIKISDEKVKYGDSIKTRAYGWSSVTDKSKTLRYLEGDTYFYGDPNITHPFNGSTHEKGDSGGPIVNSKGELVATHYGGVKQHPYNGYGYSVSESRDWIDTIINTK